MEWERLLSCGHLMVYTVDQLFETFHALVVFFVSLDKEDCPRQNAKILGLMLTGTSEVNAIEAIGLSVLSLPCL